NDTFLFSPAYTTSAYAHVRDWLDQKRMMITVVVALVPCILMAMFNTGYQAHRLVEQGGALLDTWQTAAFTALGFTASTSSVLACLVYGALHFLPLVLVTYAVGGICEVVFALVRGHEVNE